jgi:serine/threonine protein phosphatase PrpC
MEDTYLVVADLGRLPTQPRPDPGWNDTALFGVFDGHGGDAVSKFCEQNMALIVAGHPSADVGQALSSSFYRLDNEAKSSKHGGGGSTACIACINSSSICVANAGDCRAVLCRAGQAVEMSTDHRPSLESEAERIEAAGGWVSDESQADSDARVNGDLSVSRAIGDFQYKQDASRPADKQIMVPTPDVEIFQRSRADEFMIIASDGVWDVLSTQSAVDLVRRRLGRRSDLEDRLHNEDLNLQDLAAGLLDHCLAPRLQLIAGYGEDNMTVAVIVFAKSFWTAPDTPR